jgi:hypothetical protein
MDRLSTIPRRTTDGFETISGFVERGDGNYDSTSLFSITYTFI